MYRIFCESYKNYSMDFDKSDARACVAEPFRLIADVELFDAERKENSMEYKKLCDMLHYASLNTGKYPRMKAFLWTISSRGMSPFHYGVSDEAVLKEQMELISSFLKLAYWES